MCSVIKPDPKAHVRVIKRAVRNRRHVRQGVITEQHRVESITNIDEYRLVRLASVHTGTVIAPKGGAVSVVYQREFELPAAVEVCGPDDYPALITDNLWHLTGRLRADKA